MSKKKIKLARTFMPEIIAPGTGLSPSTDRAVIPFNNVHTIWDVLSGDKYEVPGGGGHWSDGEEAMPGSYKDDGQDYKRRERDLDIIRNLMDGHPSPNEEWKVKVKGGYKLFPSLEAAQAYRRKMREKGIDVPWISRTKTAAIEGEDVIDSAMTKSFKIEALNLQTNVKETGEAFCVSHGYFITCAHVVKKYNKNTESTLDFSQYRGMIKVMINDKGRQIEAEVIAFDATHDIALLKAEVESEAFVFDMSPAIGEEIFAIGSPHGFENNASFGSVSSLDRKIYFHENAPNYMFVDASVFPGNSGGPIVDRDSGMVLGMVTAIISASEDYGLNAVLPSTYVVEFCRMNGIVVQNNGETT
jgi:hypothetical protein